MRVPRLFAAAALGFSRELGDRLIADVHRFAPHAVGVFDCCARFVERDHGLVLLALGAVGLLSLVGLSAEARMRAMMGQTWYICPCMLTVLSIPGLLLMLRAARGLPTGNARQTGAALGLLAGCISAVGYSLACPEASPAFVALWYSTGLLLTTVLGALLGPRWLKW